MPPATTDHGPLTVVLVHGAFADSSSWNGVIERLQKAGIQVTAAPNPLRGISHDSAYVASFIKQVPGPVLAVGHSYGGATTEFAIDPAKVHDVFAADLTAQQAAVIAATQRPVSELAFSEASGPPAWKSLPSWTVLASPDKAAGTDVVRSMAERAGATIIEVEGSHVIMISRPDVVADVIRPAAAAVGRPAATGG